MKRFLLSSTILVLFLIGTSVYSIDDDKCVELKGFLLDVKDKKLSKVKVTLMENGKEVNSFESKCPVKLELPRDHYYSMIISSEGYVSALMIVDTYVPKSHKDCNFHFEFHYNMVPEKNEYNQEYTDFPAAVIKYQKNGDEFLISEKYNNHIKKMLGVK